MRYCDYVWNVQSTSDLLNLWTEKTKFITVATTLLGILMCGTTLIDPLISEARQILAGPYLADKMKFSDLLFMHRLQLEDVNLDCSYISSPDNLCLEFCDGILRRKI